jgi:pimeloyl-ACP methyl ester carboxylesterase
VTERTPRPAELPYLEHGSGPVVVLVHASNTDHRIWAPHATASGTRHRVIAPTQRYFGASPWSDDGENFSISTHAADLAAFIAGLQVEPVALVGWSYGAAVCLTMAVDRPELVQRLILYEPAIISFVHEPEAAETAAADRVEMIARARDQVRAGNMSAAVRAFMDGVNDRLGTFDTLAATVQEIMLENSRTLPLLFAAPPPSLSCDDLRRLEQTTVVVVRGSDTRAYYRIAADSIAECLPTSTLVVVPNARHLLPIEDHTRFTAVVQDLLAASSAP